MGARIRELRRARGLSQHALSGDGISAAYVSLIESGKRRPSRETVEKLASRLGVTAEHLLVGMHDSALERTQVDVNFARLAIANGHPAEAVASLRSMSLEDLDSATACEAALALAEAAEQTGDLDLALVTLEAMSDRCRREGAWTGFARAATTLTALYLESGDTARGVDLSQQALREVEAAGLEGTDEHIRLGSVFVWACFERGDLLFAARRAAELIDVADRIGTPRARGSIYWNAAFVAHARGRHADALRLTDRALALLGDQEDSRDLPRLRMQYAWVLLNVADPRPLEALEQLERAENDPTLAGSQLDLGTIATFRGQAQLLVGNVFDAAEQAARALQLLGPSEHIERASALILLGDVGTAQGDLDLAHECYREVERVLRTIPPSREVARTWRALGESLRTVGELDRALDAYDSSLVMLGMVARSLRVGPGRRTATATHRAAR